MSQLLFSHHWKYVNSFKTKTQESGRLNVNIVKHELEAGDFLFGDCLCAPCAFIFVRTNWE